MTPDPADIEALRHTVVSYRSTPAMVLVGGEQAYETVDALSTRDLFVRTGQLLHALILDLDGGIESDLLIAPRGEEFLLIADGLDDQALIARLQACAPTGAVVTLEAMSSTRVLLGLAGPYAWELLGDLLGPDIATMAYMSCLRIPELDPDGLCLRSGTTGEYGYELLLSSAVVPAVRERLTELGARFGLREVGVETLDAAALENGFFSPRHRGVLGRSPAEMQLQWRVTYDRVFRGSEPLQSRRLPARRIAWVIGRLDEAPASLGALSREGREVGELVEGFASPTLGCFVGLALLDRSLGHPWIDGILDREGRELRVEAPPLLQNRSLFVNPRKHVFAHRDEDEFPSIVPGESAAQTVPV